MATLLNLPNEVYIEVVRDGDSIDIRAIRGDVRELVAYIDKDNVLWTCNGSLISINMPFKGS